MLARPTAAARGHYGDTTPNSIDSFSWPGSGIAGATLVGDGNFE